MAMLFAYDELMAMLLSWKCFVPELAAFLGTSSWKHILRQNELMVK
jgi:hypothetical protein